MMRKKIASIVIYTAVFMAVPSVSAFALDRWQQNKVQEWAYKENDKKLVNQWITWMDGTLRYVGGDGKVVKGNWVNFRDKRCRVRKDGARYRGQWFNIMSSPVLPSVRPVASWYYAGVDESILKDGWHEMEGRYYYFRPGGSLPRKSFFSLDDKRYYVDESGARIAPGWFSINNVNNKGEPYTNWYYINKDGFLLRGRWHESESMTCYFDANGTVYRDRWFSLSDNRYYMNENGAKQNSWFSITGINGSGRWYTDWHHADANGVSWRNGWREGSGKWYSFDANGLNYRNRWYIDGDGDRYHLDKDGVLQDDGWFKIKSTNATMDAVTENWYYATESGTVLKGGFRELEDKRYYFDINDLSYRKRRLAEENSRRQYTGNEGYLYQDQWFAISGLDSRNSDYNNWYYVDRGGYARMDGWYKIDGQYYCLNTSGVMHTGWLTESADDEEDEDFYYYCG